ncbi:MAG: carbohydrate ABC transporter permease [Chloroflexi bacterium]|nr:carbohydrate ABC transporter permease [Chloroflexota bacterium]
MAQPTAGHSVAAARPALATRWHRTTAGRTLLSHGILHLVLIAAGITFAIPILWVLSTSLKRADQVFTHPIQWIPNPVHLSNYVDIFQVLKIGQQSAIPLFFQNSMVISVTGTLGTVLSSALVGFSLSRLRWRARDFVFAVALATMMLPGIVTLVPRFLLFRDIGWLDTYLPLIVPDWLGGGGFFIFLMRQFLRSLPYELDEAARIDGAGSFRIFWQVLMPLSQPVIATVAIFAFLGNYMDFMGPLIYLSSSEKFTLALGLRWFAPSAAGGAFGYPNEWGWVMAVTALMVAPVIVVFFVAQRQFVRGIQLTGLAGR